MTGWLQGRLDRLQKNYLRREGKEGSGATGSGREQIGGSKGEIKGVEGVEATCANVNIEQQQGTRFILPFIKNLLTETVPVNNRLLSGTVPVNNVSNERTI